MKKLLILLTMVIISNAQSDFEWEPFSPGGIYSPSIGPSGACVDTNEHLILFFSGYFDDDYWGQKLFAFNYETNALDTLPASSGDVPPDRNGYLHYFDPVKNRYFLFGGSSYSVGSVVNDMWLYSFTDSSWHEIPHIGSWPSARCQVGWVKRTGSRELVMWGGYQGGGVFVSELWAFNLDQLTWHPITYTGEDPGAYWGYAWAKDNVRNEMLVFGGHNSSSGFTNHLYALNMDSYEWREISQTGDIPSPRRNNFFAYIPEINSAVLFGGDAEHGGGLFLNDVYLLDISGYNWEELHPSGPFSPSPRGFYAVARVPTEPNILIADGLISFWTCTNDFFYLHWTDTSSVSASNHPYNTHTLAYTVFPNPTFSSFIVDLPSSVKATVRVCDVQGREVLSQKASGRTTIALAARGVPPGVYIVKLHSEKVSLSTNRQVLYIR